MPNSLRTTLWIALVLAAGVACQAPGTHLSPDVGEPVGDAGLFGSDAGLDAGSETDAGVEMDAGSEVDAGVEVDAGTESDAGSEIDAGEPDAGAAPDGGLLYDEDGPVPYTTRMDRVSNGGPTAAITTYLPSTPGPYPLVSFWAGTQQTAPGYAPYGRRLASYGIAMMIANDPGILNSTSAIVPTAVYLVDTWIPANLSNVDLSRIALSGHSRGGSLTIFAADQGLRGKVVAWLGMDAVDNPLQNLTLSRTVLPNIGIPSAFLGAAVATDCAPTSSNYVTLYPLAPSPSVLVAFNGASHTQFEAMDGCLGCPLCMPAGTADPNVVLRTAVRYFTAFFARELLGDARVGAAFEGAGAAADSAGGVVTISSK